MKFRREAATTEADLPHEFAEAELVPVCAVCTMPADEARHLAWEKQAMVDRERASVDVVREIGS